MEDAEAPRRQQGLVGQRQRRIGQLERAPVVSMDIRVLEDGLGAGDPQDGLSQKTRVVKVQAVLGGEPAVDVAGRSAYGEDARRLQTDGRPQAGRGMA